MHTIKWEKRAERELRRIDHQAQAEIIEAIDGLAETPRPVGSKKLAIKGFAGMYRIRIGLHYRVVFDVDDEAKTVRIVKVGTRESMPWS